MRRASEESMKTMKRKKPAIRSKILTFLLFAASLACTGLCLAHLIPYAEEEMRAASLHAELVALHEGGAGIDGNWATREPDGVRRLRSLLPARRAEADGGRPVSGQMKEGISL